jgi:hypothetical protein
MFPDGSELVIQELLQCDLAGKGLIKKIAAEPVKKGKKGSQRKTNKSAGDFWTGEDHEGHELFVKVKYDKQKQPFASLMMKLPAEGAKKGRTPQVCQCLTKGPGMGIDVALEIMKKVAEAGNAQKTFDKQFLYKTRDALQERAYAKIYLNQAVCVKRPRSSMLHTSSHTKSCGANCSQLPVMQLGLLLLLL